MDPQPIPNVSVSSPEIQPVQKSNKTSVIAIIIALLSLGISLFLGYQNVQLKRQLSQQTERVSSPQKEQPTAEITTIQPTIDQTAQWKTYQITNTPYSLKYPQDMVVSGAGDWTSFSVGSSGPSLNYKFAGNKSSQTLEQFIASYTESNTDPNQSALRLESQTSIASNGIPGYKGETNSSVYYFFKDSNAQGIAVFKYVKNIDQSDQTLFSQVVSTIAFTRVGSVSDTSTWKTYTNSEYKYAITLPDIFSLLEDNHNGTISINPAAWRFGKKDLSRLKPEYKKLDQNAITLEIVVFDEKISRENYNLTCNPEVLTFNMINPVVNKSSRVESATDYLEYSGVSAYDTQPDTPWWSSNICFMHDQHFYHLNYWSFENTKVDPLLNQILSTFKFL